jgi:hypothetical protein
MIVLHAGFDGLDLALKARPGPELVAFLEEAKACAEAFQQDAVSTFNGLRLIVGATGAKGGYAYRFDTGRMGATWFAKKPREKDPWGIRLSVKSRPLALLGLDRVREEIDATCTTLGLRYPPGGVSIGRVDFAVDILAPDFTLDPTAFVIHARTNRKAHTDLAEMATNGPSGRYTSVTLGKMPGRQVILYDKREEVRKKHKPEWPLIWNETLACLGLPPLDLDDRATSTVWRAELRLGKDGLRQTHDIRGWGAFHEHLQEEMNRLAEDVTYRLPGTDSNRSRWPLHPIWQVVQQTVATRLFNHEVTVPPDSVRELDLAQKRREIESMIAGLAVPLGVLDGKDAESMGAVFEGLGKRIERTLRNGKRGLADRVADARERYSDVL